MDPERLESIDNFTKVEINVLAPFYGRHRVLSNLYGLNYFTHKYYNGPVQTTHWIIPIFELYCEIQFFLVTFLTVQTLIRWFP